MIKRVEITKLNHHEFHNSHLIQIGPCNIICDVPLSVDRLLLKDTYVSDSIRLSKEDIALLDDMSQKLAADRKYMPLNIHFLLISSVDGFVGLPILCKYFDLSKTEIICTKPTYYFALCVIQNLQKREQYLPLWEDDENEKIYCSSDEQKYYNFDASLKKNMHLLSYKEKLRFAFKDVTLEFSCFSSGYALGSCNFFIKSNFLNLLVLNKCSYNLKRYPSPIDVSCFEDADIVLFTTYMPHPKNWNIKQESKETPQTEINEAKDEDRQEEQNTNIKKKNGSRSFHHLTLTISEKINVTIGVNYKDSIKKLCSAVICSIKKKGCVLIPIDLYFLYFLEITEMIGVAISKYLRAEDQVTIYTVMSNINDAIYYAESCADWVDDSRKEKCCRARHPEHPFSFNMMKRNNRLAVGDTVNDITNLFKYPCVCFIQDSSLRLFESGDVFKKIMDDEKNTLILVDPMYDPVKVLEKYDISDSKIGIYYCPIWWQISEFDILQIIHNNRNKKCEYIIPMKLKPIFQNKDIQFLMKNSEIIDMEKYIYNLGLMPQKKMEPYEDNSMDLKDFNDCLMEESEEYITTTIARKILKTPLEKSIKKKKTPRTDGTFSTSDKQFKNYVVENMKEEIDWEKINYICSYKKIRININDFAEMDKRLKPIRFFCDQQMELEKRLNKAEGVFFAKVNGQLTTSYMGDLLSAEDIHLEEETDKHDIKGETKKEDEATEEKKEKEEEEKEEGKGKYEAEEEEKGKEETEKEAEEKIKKNVKQKGKNNARKKRTEETEKSQMEVENEKMIYDENGKNVCLFHGVLKATDVKDYLVMKGYDPKDVEICYDNVEELFPWRVKIKHSKGEIICYNAYDIEVDTSNEVLRQQVVKMLFDLMQKF